MSLGRLEGMQQLANFRFTMGVKIGLLVSLLTGTAIALLAVESSGTGFGSEPWLLKILVITVIAVPVIVMLRMIVQQIRLSIVRYTDFVDRLGNSAQSALLVEQGSKELRELGAALNTAHQRLQQKEAELQSMSADQNQFFRLVDESPNIVLLMDADGEVQYLNRHGRLIADAFGLGEKDISVILPQTPAALVEKCIVNGETLKEQKASYRDKKILWTFFPVSGKSMLQAYGTVVSNQRKADYSFHLSGNDGNSSHLYPIARHPDYHHYSGSILVIDGDDLLQRLMARYFQRDGFCVISARNGEQGLELAKQRRPDLITLDIMMPGKNGWMVLSTLKETPELASIPVVIVSSVGNERFVHAMGADDYVQKPIDWKALGKIVNKLSGNNRKLGAF
ncbi:MAG: response regulator [Acidiferrobacterales bacterium]